MRAGTFIRINIVNYTVTINGLFPFLFAVLSKHLKVIRVHCLNEMYVHLN